MPAKAMRNVDPLINRLSTNVDRELLQAFRQRALLAGQTDARYLRHLIAEDAGKAVATPPLKRRQMQRVQLDALAHEVNQLGLQFRKIGVNVNQLAKQANAGMVPVTRAEAVRAMTQLDLAMSQALAVLERALA